MLDHLSIQCADPDASRAFYERVLAPIGGKTIMDFGGVYGMGVEVLHEPRVWPEYHEGYDGGFVRDLDGNNIEAVHHTF